MPYFGFYFLNSYPMYPKSFLTIRKQTAGKEMKKLSDRPAFPSLNIFDRKKIKLRAP